MVSLPGAENAGMSDGGFSHTPILQLRLECGRGNLATVGQNLLRCRTREGSRRSHRSAREGPGGPSS